MRDTTLRSVVVSQVNIILPSPNTPTPLPPCAPAHPHPPESPVRLRPPPLAPRWLQDICYSVSFRSHPDGGPQAGGFLVLGGRNAPPPPAPYGLHPGPICFPLSSTRQGAATARLQGCEVYVAGFGAGGDRATHTHADIHWTSPTLLYVNTSIYPHVP